MKVQLAIAATVVAVGASRLMALPITGAINENAFVRFTTPGGSTSSVLATPASSSWVGVPAPLSGDTAVTVIMDANNSVSVYNRGAAFWAPDGNSGTFSIEYGWQIRNPNHAWTFVTTDAGIMPSDSGVRGRPDWTYTFVPDATGIFSVSYDLAPATNGHSLAGLNILSAYSGPTGNFDSVPVHGAFGFPVMGGDTYTVSIVNYGNILTGSPDTTSRSAVFSWHIAVPDPGSTLGYVGFALAAMAVASQFRRREG